MCFLSAVWLHFSGSHQDFQDRETCQLCCHFPHYGSCKRKLAVTACVLLQHPNSLTFDTCVWCVCFRWWWEVDRRPWRSPPPPPGSASLRPGEVMISLNWAQFRGLRFIPHRNQILCSQITWESTLSGNMTWVQVVTKLYSLSGSSMLPMKRSLAGSKGISVLSTVWHSTLMARGKRRISFKNMLL